MLPLQLKSNPCVCMWNIKYFNRRYLIFYDSVLNHWWYIVEELIAPLFAPHYNFKGILSIKEQLFFSAPQKWIKKPWLRTWGLKKCSHFVYFKQRKIILRSLCRSIHIEIYTGLLWTHVYARDIYRIICMCERMHIAHASHALNYETISEATWKWPCLFTNFCRLFSPQVSQSRLPTGLKYRLSRGLIFTHIASTHLPLSVRLSISTRPGKINFINYTSCENLQFDDSSAWVSSDVAAISTLRDSRNECRSTGPGQDWLEWKWNFGRVRRGKIRSKLKEPREKWESVCMKKTDPMR